MDDKRSRLIVWLMTFLAASHCLAAGGDLLWETRAKESFGCAQLATSNGLAFTYATGQRSVAGGSESFPLVRAYDPATGAELWEAAGGTGFGPVELGPPGIAAAAGRVVAIEQQFDGSFLPPGPAAVTAWQATSGELLWRRQLPDDGSERVVTAVAAGSGVVALVGDRTREVAPEEWIGEIMVLAYDAATGEPLWSDTTNLAGKFDHGRDIVVRNGRVFVVGTARRSDLAPVAIARAYDARTGALLWQRERPRREVQAVSLSRNRLVTLAWTDSVQDGFLIAYAADSGRELWRRRVRGAIMYTLDARPRRLFAFGPTSLTSPVGARLRAFDARTGKPLWGRREPGVLGQRVLGARGRAYSTGLVSPQGATLRAYGGRTGRLAWSADASAAEAGFGGCSIALVQGRIVATAATSNEALVRAFEP